MINAVGCREKKTLNKQMNELSLYVKVIWTENKQRWILSRCLTHKIKSLQLTSDLEITIRVTALLSDERPLNAFSNASAKNRGGLRVHRTKMTKKNEINVTNSQTTSSFSWFSIG